jgi:hypothetical protein
MNTPQIKTHNMKNEYLNQNHFFILSKGDNAGKPLLEPCPNCFVLISGNNQDREYYYWLCYGLWVGGFFKPYLSGSVISFLRITELNHIIRHTTSKIQLRREALIKAIKTLNELNTYQDNLTKQIQLIKVTKQALMYKVLK